jgi:chromosome partitioning protein
VDEAAVAADSVEPDGIPAGAESDVSRETSVLNPVPSGLVSRETVAGEPAPLADLPAEPPASTGGVGPPAEVGPVDGAHRVEEWPRPTERKVFTVANQKGGVGKTTSTVNLAACLAQHGARVLVIDLDPQGNASTAFGIDHHENIPSVYDVLVQGAGLTAVAVPAADVPGLECVPATIDLAGAEIELVSVVARESRLRKAIDALDGDYDYVFIDCPPSLGLLTVNALVAGREVLIPIQCEFYALEGLSQLLRNIELVRSHLNEDLLVSTILLTMYDARTRLAEQVAAEVRNHFGEVVLASTIPRSVRISEAPGYGQSVMTYDPASRGAAAYAAAAYEVALRASGRHAGGETRGEQ